MKGIEKLTDAFEPIWMCPTAPYDRHFASSGYSQDWKGQLYDPWSLYTNQRNHRMTNQRAFLVAHQTFVIFSDTLGIIHLACSFDTSIRFIAGNTRTLNACIPNDICFFKTAKSTTVA